MNEEWFIARIREASASPWRWSKTLSSRQPNEYSIHCRHNVNYQETERNNISAFGDYCRNALEFTEKSCPEGQRNRLHFDQFKEFSIKDSERRRRKETHPVDLSTINKNTPIRIHMTSFWASNANDQKLQALLHEEMINTATRIAQPEVQTVVTDIPGDPSLHYFSVVNGVVE